MPVESVYDIYIARLYCIGEGNVNWTMKKQLNFLVLSNFHSLSPIPIAMYCCISFVIIHENAFL